MRRGKQMATATAAGLDDLQQMAAAPVPDGRGAMTERAPGAKEAGGKKSKRTKSGKVAAKRPVS